MSIFGIFTTDFLGIIDNCAIEYLIFFLLKQQMIGSLFRDEIYKSYKLISKIKII